MEYSYEWLGAARTPAKPKAGAESTPSRSSRRSGFTNLTHYSGFSRSDGAIFRIGDAVQVWEGAEFSNVQVWLDPYRSFGTESAQSATRAGSHAQMPGGQTGKRTPSKKGKGKARMAQREEDDESWIVDDGLDDHAKYGIIIDLWEDETESMRAAIHWLARPRLLCYLFGKSAGQEEGLDDCHPRELIYAFDPSHYAKDKSHATSRAEDIHDVSYLLNRIETVSKTGFDKSSADTETNALSELGGALQDQTPAFFIRRALNTKAEQSEGWFYDIEWQDIYEKGCSSGNWELQIAEEGQEEVSTPARGRKKGRASTAREGKGASKLTGSAKTRRVAKKAVKEVVKDILKTTAASQPSPTKRRGRSRATSADTEMLSESGSDNASSSSEEEEDEANAGAEDDPPSSGDEYSEAELDVLPSSSDEDEGPPLEVEASDLEIDDDEDDDDFDDDFDVFGPVTASGRKRKIGGKRHSSDGSPRKRGKGRGAGSRSSGALLVRPSAATVRKNAARAARQAQRLAERQARRLKPRLPLVQQKHIGQAVAEGPGKQLAPFEKARAVLHVGCTPDYLPCRDEEYAEIEAYLEDAIDEGVGSCIYIAGVPGTGKTATVRSVISSLQERAQNEEIKSFRFLEVNGMKITDPAQAFSILWEFISGNRISPKAALAALETHFKTPNPGRDTCVVLVDELDQLVTKKQEVIYNFFNWPNQGHSRLIVLAVANTMDLPERELSNKITSRLGSNRINFAPYTKQQLIEILGNRLEGLDGVFAKEAVGLVASKVASVTGDARRALDICRRAVEKVEAENMLILSTMANARAGDGQGYKENPKMKVVTAADIVTVHKDMTSSGLMLFVKRAGLHQRIMLLALSRAIRKVGVADEVEFGDVIRWHLDFCRQTAVNPLPTHTTLFSVLQSLADMKLVTTEGSRLDYFQRVQANVSDDELELVLRKETRFVHYLR